MTTELVLQSGSATDVGRRRTANQDLAVDGDPLFAVADGMGGYEGGEVAASVALEALRASFGRTPSYGGLEDAIADAHRAVVHRANESAELAQMGTTLTALARVDVDGQPHLAVANIGDSRAYLLRDGELERLTDDHSVPQEMYRAGEITRDEADVHPRRNYVTRALGPQFEDGPDMQLVIPYAGDRYLVCSDGLHGEVDDAAIARILRTVVDPGDAAHQLVALANEAGGSDNVTVVVVDVVDDGGAAREAGRLLAAEPPPKSVAAERRGLMTAHERDTELRQLNREGDAHGELWPGSSSAAGGVDRPLAEAPTRRVTPRVVLFAVAVVIVFALGVGAIGVFARATYHVGVDPDTGRVAIFRGRPGGLLWFDPEVVETTSLTQGQVPVTFFDEIDTGKTFADRGGARRYVERLEAEAIKEGAAVDPQTTSTTTPPAPATPATPVPTAPTPTTATP